MTLGDTSLPRAVERAIRFLGESDQHRLNLAATNFPMVVHGPEAFVARMFAPERPRVEFLAAEDIRETMSWLAKPRKVTEYVEVEKVVERRIYIPVETPAAAPPPKEETKPAAPEKPFAGMDQTVSRFAMGSSVATLGLGSYLMGLAAPHAASSSFTAFDSPRIPFGNMPFVRPHHPFATLTDPGGNFSAFGTGPDLGGMGGYGDAGTGDTGSGGGGFWSDSGPGPMPLAGGAGSPFIPLLGGLPALGGTVGIVQRLAPVIQEAVQRSNGVPATILQLPGALAATAMDRGVGPADQRSLQEAAVLAFRNLPQETAAAMGQVSLIAPDLQLASPESAQSGTAVSMAWQDLAPGAGPLDEAGLGRLKPLLPSQAQLIYPALPAGTAGATTFALAPSLIERLMNNYGPGVANAARSVAPQAAAAGSAAVPTAGAGKRIPASIVPLGRPGAGAGGLFGGQGNPLEEAGGGQAKRGGSLDFLGVPVQLAPSLATDPGVRQERSLARTVSEVTGGAPARPEAFSLLRNRLFPSMGSVVAEPNLPAWQRRAQEVGLRDASPASLLASDARSDRPTLGSKPQIDGGPLGQAARPFAPALALSEMSGSQSSPSAPLSPNVPGPGMPHVFSSTSGGAGSPTHSLPGVGIHSPMNIHRPAGGDSMLSSVQGGIGHAPSGPSLIPNALGSASLPTAAPLGASLPSTTPIPSPSPTAFEVPAAPAIPKVEIPSLTANLSPSSPPIPAHTPTPGVLPRALPHLAPISDGAAPGTAEPLRLGTGVAPRVRPTPGAGPIGRPSTFPATLGVNPLGVNLATPASPIGIPSLTTRNAPLPLSGRSPAHLGIHLPFPASPSPAADGPSPLLPAMPAFSGISIPPPAAGSLRPSAALPTVVASRVVINEAPAAPEMPVLRRPVLPAVQKSGPPAMAAGGSARIQFSKGSVDSLPDTQSRASSGGQGTAPETDGAKVQLLAREVYGILRRRLRDEKERAHPYGGF